jgi:hypothetical protein
VVSRSVPKNRAKNDIHLMNQPVEAPDAATKQYWTRTMSRLPIADHIDVQSTIGYPNAATTRFVSANQTSFNKKSLAQRLGLKK